jgi:hypothetical protein
MKERFAKIGNKTKMIAGALALAALMAVNVQVGMNNGDSSAMNLQSLEASIYSPTAIATVSPGDCAMNGYKTWEGGWFGTRAKDCWCSTIRKPLQSCSY